MQKWSAIALVLFGSTQARAETLEVGPKHTYATLADALEHAKSGDEIVVFPQAGNAPYKQVALLIGTPKLTIRSAAPDAFITLDGASFDYSGKGRTPRAIVQFDPGADGCVLEGFEFIHARNDSFNAAGVRINEANQVTIRRCRISECDMGIMSNGHLSTKTGADQLVEGCTITANGNEREAGYNHNLYVGGTSITIRACDISRSTTGHNVKSRAHLTRLEYNFIHDSANREIDLVDEAGNTDAPASDAILIGNFIAKRSDCPGNHGVIHFGKDGQADHTGTLVMAHNTIRTPFASPVVLLTASGSKLAFNNNLVEDSGAKQAGVLVELPPGGKSERASGAGSRWPAKFSAPASIFVGGLVNGEALRIPGVSPLKQFRSVGTLDDNAKPAAGAGEPKPW